ncbi:MAG: hypothetical protein K2O67_06485, partial [Clostridia bacterium]|nr:hypothetical protein [Clostridia bacterium]
MNKSKSKKLILGILLCICLAICAVLLAFANSKGGTVYAADDEPTVKLEHGNVKYAYTGGGNDTKYGNTSCTVATFPYGSFDYSGSLASTSPSTTGASYSVGESSKDYKYKGAYEDFAIKVTMPAGKKYRIKFTFDFSSSKNQTNGQSTSRTRAEVFYFGNEEDKSASLNFAIAHSGGVAPGNSSSYTINYCQSTGSTVSTVSGTGETAITYDNSKNGSAKEFTSYFGFYAYAGGSLNIHTKLSASWSYSYKVMHNPVDVPTIKADFISVSGSTYKYEAKYTGAKQTFTYNNLNATYITANYNSLSVNKVDSSDYVTFSLVGTDCFWNDEKGGTGSRYLEVTVVRGDPKVVVDKVTTCKKELPDEVPLNKEKSQKGTAHWFPGRYEPDEVTGEPILVEPPASIENPKWVFVPEDDENYTEAMGIATIDDSHTFPEENHVKKVEATCTQGGNIEYWQCSVCEKYFSDSEGNTEISLQEVSVEALGHNITEVAAEAATCTADGNYKYYSCSRCDGLFWDNAGNSACTEEDVFEEKLGHDTTDTVVAPTCTSRGYTTHTCTREGCDYTYDDTYTNMSPHDWDEGEETTAATCTATGVTTYTCTVCSTTKTEQIEELGHTSEDIEAVAATCTAKGKTAGTKCSVCNAVLTAPEDTDALGHDFSITVSGTQPTCQHGGTATMKCSRCDATETQDSADPVDHVFTNYE